MYHRRILSVFQSPMWVITHLKANKNTPEMRCFTLLIYTKYFCYLH
nr:MAG TPA: hypothetical protein [Caudoviricetes sp.]